MFYSAPGNVLAPGLATVMSDGWETARRRDDGHDWLVVALAAPGLLHDAVIDTSRFAGNAPGWATLTDDETGAELLGRTRLLPDTEHRFRLRPRPGQPGPAGHLPRRRHLPPAAERRGRPRGPDGRHRPLARPAPRRPSRPRRPGRLLHLASPTTPASPTPGCGWLVRCPWYRMASPTPADGQPDAERVLPRDCAVDVAPATAIPRPCCSVASCAHPVVAQPPRPSHRHQPSLASAEEEGSFMIATDFLAKTGVNDRDHGIATMLGGFPHDCDDLPGGRRRLADVARRPASGEKGWLMWAAGPGVAGVGWRMRRLIRGRVARRRN